MAKKKTPAETPATSPAAPARRRAAPKPKGATDERVQVGSDVVTVSAADTTTVSTPGNGDARVPPSYDQIAEAAYLRYLNRGGSHGQDFDDWVEAERALRSRE